MIRSVAAVVLLTAAAAACSGSSTPTAPSSGTPNSTPPAPSASVAAMLQDLPAYITWALTTNQNLLPNNPGSATFIQAKITILQRPGLVGEITGGQFWSEGTTTSRGGRVLPIVAMFPTGGLRTSAARGVQQLEAATPVLETFLATPLPAGVIRLWYGFIVGNSGGGGSLNMEDQESYEARTAGNALPYEAILYHELSHSYIGHESLNQFLELFVYNMVHTNSPDLEAWVFVRGHVAGLASNEGVHALLDVYQQIGRDAMASAYRTVYPLHPPYGQPLSAACKQAFVDQAPAAAKALVAAKMAKVTY